VQPPKLLIADEPTLGLAPLVVADVLELVQRLAADGVAVVLVEEKTRDVLALADEVTFLQLGTVPWSGSRDEVADEHLDAVYLGGVGG
jgi:ABC-type branched-subunit amino acid transport system ATPase component